MADDSDDEAVDASHSSTGEQAESPPSDRSAISFDFDLSTAPSSTTARSAVAHGELDREGTSKEEQVDAWNLEDWDSPMSHIREVATPCRAATRMQSKQTEVVDAVRAELQADIESVVRHAIDEIRSWVSEEIAFARQCFQEEMHQVQVPSQAQMEDMKKGIEEQSRLVKELQVGQRLEKLEGDLKEQMHLVQRLREDMPAAPIPTNLDGGRETKSSDRVAEARVVAEERKWRLRLESIETGLERNSESLEELTKKSLELSERMSAQDADVQRGLGASLEAEKQLAMAAKEVLTLKQHAENQAQQLCRLEQTLQDEQQAKTGETAALQKNMDACSEHIEELCRSSQANSDETAALQKNLDACSERIEELCSSFKVDKQANINENLALQKSIDACSDRIEELCLSSKVDKEASVKENSLLQKNIGACSERIEELWRSSKVDKEAHSVENAALQKGIEACRKHVEDFCGSSKAEAEKLAGDAMARLSKLEAGFETRVEKLEKEAATAESELATVQECLEKHNDLVAACDAQTTEIRELLGAEEVKLRKCEDSLRKLNSQASKTEQEVAKVQSGLSEQGRSIAGLSMKATETSDAVFEAIRSLEEQLATSDKARVAFRIQLDSQEEQMERLEQKSSSLTEQMDAQMVEMKDSTTALRQLEEQMATKSSTEAFKLLEEQVTAQETKMSSGAKALKWLEEQMEAQSMAMQSGTEALKQLEAQIASAESERLAELKVVCAKVENQQGEVQALSAQFRTQLRAVRQSFGRAVDELRAGLESRMESKAGKDDVQEALAARDGKLADMLNADERLDERISELARQTETMQAQNAQSTESSAKKLREVESDLRTKASIEELMKTNGALHTWVEETRQALDKWLAMSLDQFRGEQRRTLQKHEGWVQNVTGWIEQVHVREQGLSHVILHLLNQGHPELVKLLEEALMMPQRPDLESSEI